MANGSAPDAGRLENILRSVDILKPIVTRRRTGRHFAARRPHGQPFGSPQSTQGCRGRGQTARQEKAELPSREPRRWRFGNPHLVTRAWRPQAFQSRCQAEPGARPVRCAAAPVVTVRRSRLRAPGRGHLAQARRGPRVVRRSARTSVPSDPLTTACRCQSTSTTLTVIRSKSQPTRPDPLTLLLS